jgi:microsomal dipeptidase-like Zn-dependent dipeptidase
MFSGKLELIADRDRGARATGALLLMVGRRRTRLTLFCALVASMVLGCASQTLNRSNFGHQSANIPHWDAFKKESCTDSGKRLYSAALLNISDGVAPTKACLTTPAAVAGWSFPGAVRCAADSIERGEFDVPDSTCSERSDYDDTAPPTGTFEKINLEAGRSCDAECANLGGEWGLPGMCIEARIDAGLNAGRFIRCVDLGRSFGAGRTTCYCGDQPLGFADTHNHQFANLAFGGKWVWGAAYGPVQNALASCAPIHSGLSGIPADLVGAAESMGQGGSLPLIHEPSGFPEFKDWPAFDSPIHQGVYEDWLFRAYQGGLRLMVMHAVNNDSVCRLVGPASYRTCNDQEAIFYQIRAAKAMEKHINQEFGGPGKGWYRIAYSAAGARRALEENKLVVVLGAEVDFLFGCSQDKQCSEAYVREQVDRYWRMGIRHFFPIHFDTNGFGGDAIFNVFVTHGVYRDCSAEGYLYPCNDAGLTELGKALIREAIRHRMIIDVDHMSVRARSDAFSLFEAANYPPISGHTGLLDMTAEERRNEANLSGTEVEKVKKLGGMVNVLISPGSRLGDTKVYPSEQHPEVNLQCGLSSQNFAQHYLYLVEKMDYQPVGVGTDFNVLVQPGPRFEKPGTSLLLLRHACVGGGPTNPQTAMVTYPFAVSVKGAVTGLDKSAIGKRTFDINYDGVAHIGMLPDFIEDLKEQGVRPRDLLPLFNSADGYVRLWEKIDNTSRSSTGDNR